MEGVVLFGIAGKDGLWLADLDKGTVIPYTQPLSGDLATAASWRVKGVSVGKGVDFAIAVGSTSAVASGLYEG
jgi:hypothetical protein